MAQRREIGNVYAAGMIQGVALVTFPAAGSIFTSSQYYGLSSSAYGGMFLPQALMAIAASVAGGLIAFYQLGYGLAAFGVGPLEDRVGLSLRTIFGAASVVALAMEALAVVLTRQGAPVTSPAPKPA